MAKLWTIEQQTLRVYPPAAQPGAEPSDATPMLLEFSTDPNDVSNLRLRMVPPEAAAPRLEITLRSNGTVVDQTWQPPGRKAWDRTPEPEKAAEDNDAPRGDDGGVDPVAARDAKAAAELKAGRAAKSKAKDVENAKEGADKTG